MKKFILLLFIAAMLSSCVEKPFRGFLVHKECIKYHMSNERPKVIQEASLFGVVVNPHLFRTRRKPKLIPSEWRFYVANRNGVYLFKVDSLTYLKYKCGDRIVMN